jgi:hypothetical protein
LENSGALTSGINDLESNNSYLDISKVLGATTTTT